MMNTLSNNQIKYLKQLQQKKFREQSKEFLVEGFRGVEEALKSDWEVESVISTSETPTTQIEKNCISLIRAKKIPFFILSEKEFETLSETQHSQGVLAVVRKKDFNGESFYLNEPSTLLVAFDCVGDPGNLGTMLRSCDWFGVNGILLSKNCVELYNPKVVRASMGAIFHLPVLLEQDLEKEIPALQAKGFTIVTATVQAKKSLFEITLPQKTLIIFGSEAHGVSPSLENLADVQFAIPQYGKAESLNVAAACAAVLTVWRMGK